MSTPRAFKSEFWRGTRRGIPVIVASAPFGVLFGALAVQNGFTVGEAVLMSAAVFAGASQMVGIELFGKAVPAWMIVLSIFAVNFRHVLYSASFGRRTGHWTAPQRALGFFFLADPQFAESERKAEAGETIGFAWYLGIAVPMYSFWVFDAWIGALFGRLIPDPHTLGLDFLLPIYFVGLLMGFRKRPLWLPVVIASGAAAMVAHEWVGSPWHVSIGALAGIVLAAAMPVGADAQAAYGAARDEREGRR
ncbi:MAG: AzlC family ABC transporter permease [Mesorhizobium sp.]